MNKRIYEFSYEPEPNKDGKYQEPEWCVWHDQEGKEVFRMKYRAILEMSRIWAAPVEIREYIEHWLKMLHNPD